jgi:hypothetical protein
VSATANPTAAAKVRKPASGRAKLLLLLFTIVLVVGVPELVLRLVRTPWQVIDHRVQEPHGFYGHANMPSVDSVAATAEFRHRVRHNAQRMRADREYTARKPEGTRARVLFLGDSFTYGYGVEEPETFVRRWAGLHTDFEVINTGVPGYGQGQQLAVLDRLGPALKPDVVVLVWFCNDLIDNVLEGRPDYRLSPDGKVERADGKTWPGPNAEPLAPEPPGTPKRRSTPLKRFYIEDAIQDQIRPWRFRVRKAEPEDPKLTERRKQSWPETERLLGLIRTRCDELGTKLIVVNMPESTTIDASWAVPIWPAQPVDPAGPLGELCGRIGVPFVDLTPALGAAHRAVSGRPEIFYFLDRHLTPKGHGVVVEEFRKLLDPLVDSALPKG